MAPYGLPAEVGVMRSVLRAVILLHFWVISPYYVYIFCQNYHNGRAFHLGNLAVIGLL